MNRESERKRLVELILKQTCNHNACENSIDCLHCKFVSLCDEEAEDLANALLDSGIVVPPVKVGEKVYVVDYTRLGNMIFECTIEEISHFTYGTYYYLNWGLHIPRFKACQETSFGKTVFTSKEEAEKMLKEEGK